LSFIKVEVPVDTVGVGVAVGVVVIDGVAVTVTDGVTVSVGVSSTTSVTDGVGVGVGVVFVVGVLHETTAIVNATMTTINIMTVLLFILLVYNISVNHKHWLKIAVNSELRRIHIENCIYEIR
jgi:hypothetical protein